MEAKDRFFKKQLGVVCLGFMMVNFMSAATQVIADEADDARAALIQAHTTPPSLESGPGSLYLPVESKTTPHARARRIHSELEQSRQNLRVLAANDLGLSSEAGDATEAEAAALEQWIIENRGGEDVLARDAIVKHDRLNRQFLLALRTPAQSASHHEEKPDETAQSGHDPALFEDALRLIELRRLAEEQKADGDTESARETLALLEVTQNDFETKLYKNQQTPGGRTDAHGDTE